MREAAHRLRFLKSHMTVYRHVLRDERYFYTRIKEKRFSQPCNFTERQR